MIPSQGRIVLYKLTKDDVEAINLARGKAHTAGNYLLAGETYPAVIVSVWGKTEGSAVNLKVFLDGDDNYWATSRTEGDKEGQWSVPPRV